MELFTVACTTCKARLKVRDEAAIGQILACPKCGSMVEVLSPPDWQSASTLEVKHPEAAAAPEVEEKQSNLALKIALVASPLLTLAAVFALWFFLAPENSAPAVAQAPLAAAPRAETTEQEKPPKPEEALSEAESQEATSEAPAKVETSEEEAPALPTDTAPPKEETLKPEKVASAPDDVSAAQKSGVSEPEKGSGAKNQGTGVEERKDVEPAADPADKPKAVARGAPALVQTPLTPRPAEEVSAQLDTPLPSLSVRDAPLCDLLEVFQRLSTLSITLDAVSFARAGIGVQRPVTFSVEGATVREALSKLLAQEKLELRLEGDQLIVVGPAANDTLLEEKHAISDLTKGNRERGEWVAHAVEQLTHSPVQTGGSQTAFLADAETLTVKADAFMQSRVRQTLDAWRRGAQDASQRKENAWSTSVHANFLPSASLKEVAHFVAGKAGARPLFDYARLARAGISEESQFALSVNGMSAERTLALALASAELGFVRVESEMIQITSAEGAAGLPETRCYSPADYNADAPAFRARVEEFRSQYPREFEGESPSAARCLILFDEETGIAIVRSAPSTHALLAAFLASSQTEK